MHPVIWLTGGSGSGKTTVSEILLKLIGGVGLDGNKVRKYMYPKLGFSSMERQKHNVKTAKMAAMLSLQMPVVVSVIAPLQLIRQGANKAFDSFGMDNRLLWFYLKRKTEQKEGHFYEIPVPSEKIITVDADKNDAKACAEIIADHLRSGNVEG